MSREREREANATLEKNGMTVHQPDAGMKAAFAKVGDQILAEWLKAAGADGEAIVKRYRGK
jgi:TRAP-type C4-dicarboxylate transport system substrate-binding protein